MDKVVQGNTSNIVFLKSTDDSMLDTLQKMSGTTHKVFTNSKTITRDTEAVFQNLSGNEGKTSYTMTAQEVPVISYNDMAFISPRNSIVFRAGDSPIWNRNETILPMSWRLRAHDIKQLGMTTRSRRFLRCLRQRSSMCVRTSLTSARCLTSV